MVLNFIAGCQYLDSFYFSAWQLNGLFRLNCNRSIDFIGFFNEDESVQLHSKAFLYENQLWFIPCFGEKIAIYDIEKNRFEYLPLPKEGYEINDDKGKRTFKFDTLTDLVNDVCWLAPIGYSHLLKINLKAKKIELCGELYKKIGLKAPRILSYSYVLKDKVIMMCPYRSNKVFQISTVNFLMDIINFGSNKLRYRNILIYKGKILLIPYKLETPILVVDEDGRIIKKIVIKENVDTTFVKCEIYNNYLFMFPLNGNVIISVNLFNDYEYKLQKLDLNDSIHDARLQGNEKWNDKFIVCPDENNNDKWLLLDKDFSIQSFSCKYPDYKYYRELRHYYHENKNSLIFKEKEIPFVKENSKLIRIEKEGFLPLYLDSIIDGYFEA